MADDGEVLARQIDEELRQDQLRKLWDKYGMVVLGGAAAIVIGVGGAKWYEAYSKSAAETAGAQFEQALSYEVPANRDKLREALTGIAKSGPQGYAALAKLALASDAVKSDQPDKAVEAYEQVASDTSADQILREYASLQIASLKLDTANFTEIQNRLKDLAADGAAWRHNARELLGVAALRAGKLPEARQALEPLVLDATAPEGIRERSDALMKLVVANELAAKAPKSVELEPVAEPKDKEAGTSDAKATSNKAVEPAPATGTGPDSTPKTQP